MKTSSSKHFFAARLSRRFGLLGLAAALAFTSFPVRADNRARSENYQRTNLVANLPGLAQLQDTNLVNPWGISSSGSGPFWISDNGSGLSTLYAVTNAADGSPTVTKLGLEIIIPGEGVPTGQLFDGAGSFNGDVFIFAGEDGTISGWNPGLGGAAELLVADTNAVYKGLTLDTSTGEPLLLLANFREGTVDVYDTNLDLTQFADPKAPKGYAPFNVQVLGGFVFVTFAKQDAEKHDDVPGWGRGLIDIFDPMTGNFTRFATGARAGGKVKEFNSPWGLAMAPTGFGKHEGQLLVGNFGSGTIMALGPKGHFRGFLENAHHNPIKVDGLWGLSFGNGGAAGVPGALYFTAGLNGEADGLFGAITPIVHVPASGGGGGYGGGGY